MHGDELQRQCHAQMQCRIEKTCAAPANGFEKISRERPAYGAGKSAKQRKRCDMCARLVSVAPSERSEDRVIEPGAHAEADHAPRENVKRQARRNADGGKPGCKEQRTCDQERPPAM